MPNLDFNFAHKTLTICEKILEVKKLINSLSDEEFGLILDMLKRLEQELRNERKEM